MKAFNMGFVPESFIAMDQTPMKVLWDWAFDNLAVLTNGLYTELV